MITLGAWTMKRTYRLEVKKLCRERLREFIKSGFTPGKLAVVRVLCFAGREALEVFEVYDQLGIARKNIVCLEKDRKVCNEIRRRYLGIQIRRQTLDEFIDGPDGGRFDIISLDFTGQLGTYAHTLQRLRARGRVADHAIFFTNFCGAREADASKGIYGLTRTSWEKHSPVEVAACFFNALCREGLSGRDVEALQDTLGYLFTGRGVISDGALRGRRSEAIHKGVRQMLRSPTNSLAGILFRECDSDGSLSREIQDFLHPLVMESIPAIAAEAAAVYRQQLALARKQGDAMPSGVRKMLDERVQMRINTTIERFAQGSPHVMYAWDVAAAGPLLISALDAFIGREQFVVAAASYKYVSDGGTPMYADLIRARRIGHFDALQRLVRRNAETLDEVLKPIEQLSQFHFDFLLYELRQGSKALRDMRWQEAPIPQRVDLGRESVIGGRRARATFDLSRRKERALRLLAREPSLTLEDIALAVGAQSTQQVAGWKAHITLGSYSGGSVEALERTADLEFEAGRCQSALEITKRLLRRNPFNVRLLRTQAKCLEELGQRREALAAVQKALEVEPRNVELLLRRGSLLRILGQYGQAVRTFQVALRVAPRNVAALVGQAQALLAQEKLADARNVFESARQIDPLCFAARFGSASCLIGLQGAKTAFTTCDELARESPDVPKVWYNRGIVCIYLNQMLAAAEDLSRAVHLDPRFFLAWLNLGHCYFVERRLENAYSAYSQASAIVPGNRETLTSLLVVCARLRKNQEFNELSRWLDDNAPVGDVEGRHVDLERELQLAPIGSAALMRRGRALFKQGLYGAAARSFGRVLRLRRNHCEARIGRAAALSRLMRFDKALSDLYRVQALDPEFRGIRRHIERTRAERDRARANVRCAQAHSGVGEGTVM